MIINFDDGITTLNKFEYQFSIIIILHHYIFICEKVTFKWVIKLFPKILKEIKKIFNFLYIYFFMGRIIIP